MINIWLVAYGVRGLSQGDGCASLGVAGLWPVSLPRKAAFSCSSCHSRIISLCLPDKAMGLFLCGWKKCWSNEAASHPPPMAELVQVGLGTLFLYKHRARCDAHVSPQISHSSTPTALLIFIVVKSAAFLMGRKGCAYTRMLQVCCCRARK